MALSTTSKVTATATNWWLQRIPPSFFRTAKERQNFKFALSELIDNETSHGSEAKVWVRDGAANVLLGRCLERLSLPTSGLNWSNAYMEVTSSKVVVKTRGAKRTLQLGL